MAGVRSLWIAGFMRGFAGSRLAYGFGRFQQTLADRCRQRSGDMRDIQASGAGMLHAWTLVGMGVPRYIGINQTFKCIVYLKY